MGGFFLGKLFQSARTRREDSCHKHSLRETSQVSVRYALACGYDGGFDRALSERSTSPESPNQVLAGIQRNNPTETFYSASGVSGAATDAERRCTEEISRLQSMRWCGVSGHRQRAVSPSLRHLVRAVAYRVSRSELSCQHRSDHY